VKLYKASQAALRLGISKQTLLRYEKKGILPDSRRNHINSWREYSDEDLRKLKTILRRGFTLIEVVMVIVIVGILTAIAIPRFQAFYAVKLDGAAKKLISDIRYVQQIAISNHTSTRIVFDSAAERYRAEEESPRGSNFWRAISSPFMSGSMITDFTNDPQYAGVNITGPSFGSSSTLMFDWRGQPVSGGEVTLSYRDNTRRIEVVATTGQVRAQ
jgi:prepilin-type N-terminal cleavage/methylation domain-containing protein